MTASAYLELQKNQKKPSKLKNKKVTFEGINFDSIAECQRYQQLQLFERAKIITDLELQPVFELQPAFRHKGKAIRAIKYIADFRYIEVGVGVVVEDTKGFSTADFLIKEKMLKYRYPDIDFRLVKQR